MALVLCGVLVLASCARHDDFPAMLPLADPPTPSNFMVTTSDDINYNLSWSVSQPSVVSFYRIYTVDPIFGISLADTTAATSAQFSTLIPTPGFQFGVSSVTVENVEGPAVFATAP